MGRPKKYTPEFIEAEAKALLEYAQKAEYPLKQGFAIERGYPSENMSRFADENEEFSQALKRMEDTQTIKLVEAMLKRKVPIAAAIFTLKNVSGWRDKNDTEHSFDDGTKRLLYDALAKKDKATNG